MGSLEFYQDGVLKKSINLGELRSYSSVSIDFNESRIPNTVSCTFVISSIQMIVSDGQTSTITAQVDTGSGFVSIASAYNSFSLTGIGIGGTSTVKMPLNFIVPSGASYKIVSSGTGINSISSTYELTL